MSQGDSWSEVFARIENRPPPKIYGIAFTPRSGSTFLSDLVRQSRALGTPGEYFNINAAFDSISRSAATSMERYFYWLTRVRQTNGVFGFEISWPWLDRLQQEGELQVLDAVDYWFFLRRRDYLLQGISLFMASQSGVFHLRDEAGASEVADSQSLDPPPAKADVEYDADAIAECVLQVVHGEYLLSRHFRECKIEPVPLWYEDMVAMSPQQLLRGLANALEIELTDEHQTLINAIEPELKKSGGAKNEDFAQRFRTERPAFIAHWDEHRGRMGAAAYRAQVQRKQEGDGQD